MSNWQLHQKHPRLAAFLMVFVLLFGAGATTLGTATPVSAVTGGYPHWDMPCEHFPYETTGKCGNYDWGPVRDGAQSTTFSPRGYGYRNCTDYVAWKLTSQGVAASDVRGLGNGGQWYDRAPTDKRSLTPEAGSAAVKLPSSTNPWGHVAYVESVNPDGTITVSEYNHAGTGAYGTRTASASALGFTRFVDFGVSTASAPVEVRPTASGTVPWNYTVLEGDSGAVSHQNGDIGKGAAVTTYNGSQQAFYYDATGGNLRHAWRISGGSWNTETLDGSGGGSGRMDGNVGANPSVAVYGDSIQVYYYDAGNGNLRHGWASSTVGWQFETLDGDSGALSHFSGNVGSVSKVVTFGSTLQIFYPNADTGNLRHAWADANGWHFENLDGDSGSIAGQVGNYGQAVGSSLAATVVNGAIQLFYYEVDGDNLRHAWYDTTTGWHFETLDGDSGAVSDYDGSVGQNPSVTYSNGSLQVFYYDASGGGLRHAWTDANGWHFEVLDGASSFIGPNHFNVGLYSSAISPDGVNIQLVYFDQRWTNLRHAWTDGSGWHFENLDGLGGGPAGRVPWDVGSFPLITSFGGTLGVFYYDILYGNLRLMQAQ